MTAETDSATVELTITVDASSQDRLIAELDRLGFDAYLQDDHELHAYVQADRWSSSLQRKVRSLLERMDPGVEHRVTVIPPENWNRQWENTVQPVVVGAFIVTPSWQRDQEREKNLIPLEIDPKMSFGTGYHATTRLMLRLMPSAAAPGDRVLDAGTGTGILAIAAAKLGASSVLGIDIDPWSEANARENCDRNGVSEIVRIELGDVETVDEGFFDLILANIQLDVIAKSLPALKERLAGGGRILVSGILLTQADSLTGHALACGLRVVDARTEAEWWAAELRIM